MRFSRMISPEALWIDTGGGLLPIERKGRDRGPREVAQTLVES